MSSQIATANQFDEHALEVPRGERFEFGKNWSNFLRVVDEEKIAQAVASLRPLCGVDALSGSKFLDIGSGADCSPSRLTGFTRMGDPTRDIEQIDDRCVE